LSNFIAYSNLPLKFAFDFITKEVIRKLFNTFTMLPYD
jgi:hypothetical protein